MVKHNGVPSCSGYSAFSLEVGRGIYAPLKMWAFPHFPAGHVKSLLQYSYVPSMPMWPCGLWVYWRRLAVEYCSVMDWVKHLKAPFATSQQFIMQELICLELLMQIVGLVIVLVFSQGIPFSVCIPHPPSGAGMPLHTAAGIVRCILCATFTMTCICCAPLALTPMWCRTGDFLRRQFCLWLP